MNLVSASLKDVGRVSARKVQGEGGGGGGGGGGGRGVKNLASWREERRGEVL